MPLFTTADFEGFRPNIYKDTEGNPTIGHGFNLKDKYVKALLGWDVVSGKRPITKDESLKVYGTLLGRARGDAINFVGQKTWDKLSPTRQNILVDMSYNLGSKLNEFEKFRKALQEQDFKKATYEMMDSEWYNQVGDRSKTLASLMI